ncbi:MAG: tRNA (N(6)-L-threonylcarbamoyladenosine(37)-C(2))-methylthiotransferase MtaB [Bacteroidales bacterium]|nr:tRNA (N(6)-L-threonylcarbamoyladenosine(37)-C(2))-methylthiotransferase MtaB [Bacteroidales bacterium]
MTLATHTLGCKLNFAETSHLQRQMQQRGFDIVSHHERADIYVINTCTVTSVAAKKCRNAIRQATALNPHAIIAVIGCLAQTDAEQIARIPGVDIILGNDQKHRLPDILRIENGELRIENYPMAEKIENREWRIENGELAAAPVPSLEGWSKAGVCSFSTLRKASEEGKSQDLHYSEPKQCLEEILNSQFKTNSQFPFHPAYSGDDRTRTFFKIQDGCDYFCTYCAIPFARGRSRSATIADTMAMARQIAATSTREVVLTGVNTGTFGQHNGETLLQLLQQLDQIPQILRYRISSIEPNLITHSIIDFIASSRAFLPHFHIPLQAGSDKVLRLMHRRYDTALYAARLAHIKEVMPHACIAADVITGFNGEDDDTFAASQAYIDSLPISYLHVFPYSDRPGTAALSLPERVPIPVRKARSIELHRLSDRKRHAFIQSQTGTVRNVLWEHSPHPTPDGTTMQGWTDNYIRLQRPYDPALAGTVTPYPIEKSTIVDNFSYDD